LKYVRDASVPHAPVRVHGLTLEEKRQAVKNVLRYIPAKYHQLLAPEFAAELEQFGHIYGYRFMPTHYPMKAHNIQDYPAELEHARAMQLMIMNNLDPAVAQFPHELITYGGNGSVFSNWIQYHLIMRFLSNMSDTQTLVLNSGHPQGLYPSHKQAPRVIISNGQLIPSFSTKQDYERMYAMGNTIYGQMTAGSWCYIGPQGIVHGTTLTVLNAGRKYLGLNDLTGKVFVTSGLGGMSGAQPKASRIAGCISVTAEVDLKAAQKRLNQGWVDILTSDLDEVMSKVKASRASGEVVSIAYHGNVVDLWEKFVSEPELLVELGSDQTSCHNVFGGGYYPAGISFDEANEIMHRDPEKFKKLVQASLRRHVEAIDKLTLRGMRFWDYGNAFLVESQRAGANVMKDAKHFKYPSYVQDIMGDIFSLGFGPFRWVCTSGKSEDLALTDRVAAEICQDLAGKANERSKLQYEDNLRWIQQAGAHQLVVGSQARILYSDHIGRATIALAFNKLVKEGKLTAPVVISRDHHDVSGTDSPYRETSNIEDGSQFTADMAVQNFVGDAIRSATWVALHNGGGVGVGLAINGGHGLVLDGSDEAAANAQSMLYWDVLNGVGRRAFAGNDNAEMTVASAMALNPQLQITLPVHCDESLVQSLFQSL
jgi:urocanate hydratase